MDYSENTLQQELEAPSYNNFGIFNAAPAYSAVLLSSITDLAVSRPINPATIISGNSTNQQTLVDGLIQSQNFVTGVSGWQIDADGNAEFNNGTFRGSLVAGSININNKFIVDSSGDVTLKNYTLISQYTAGESLNASALVCLKNNQVSFGDQTTSATNWSTTSSFSAFTYVDQNAATTNFGATTTPLLGASTTAGQEKEIYATLNLSALPQFADFDGQVLLRVYVIFGTGSHATAQVPVLRRLTSSFSESTITWNTKPADDGIVWASAQTGTAFNGETMASSNDCRNAGYIQFDITNLYRLWQGSVYTNNGFVIENNTQDGIATLGGRTRTGGGSYNQAPFEIFYITADNAGSSNLIACDGKAYAASNSDYQRIKRVIGVTDVSYTAGQMANIYGLADRSIIPGGSLLGKNYYLTDTVGTIANLTNDVIQSGKYDIRVGFGSSNGLVIDLEKNPILITQVSYPGVPIFPPQNARVCLIQYEIVDTSGATFQGSITLTKPFITAAASTAGYIPGQAVIGYSASWAAGTLGTLTITSSGSSINFQSLLISWFT